MIENRKSQEQNTFQLAEHYGTILQDVLRDGLVWGMKHERIQQGLLSKDDTLTLEKAIDIAQTTEPVIKQSSLIRSTQGVEDHLENIHKVQNKENFKLLS